MPIETYKPMGFQQITSLSSATALTAPTGAKLAIVHAETQNVRWRDDGTNPSATVGMILTTTGELRYDVRDPNTLALGAIKFIEVAASAKINVSYYG